MGLVALLDVMPELCEYRENLRNMLFDYGFTTKEGASEWCLSHDDREIVNTVYKYLKQELGYTTDEYMSKNMNSLWLKGKCFNKHDKVWSYGGIRIFPKRENKPYYTIVLDRPY